MSTLNKVNPQANIDLYAIHDIYVIYDF